jgi:hypothetical protein
VSDTASIIPLDPTSTYTGSAGWLYEPDEQGSPYQYRQYRPAAMLAALAPGTVHAAQPGNASPDVAPVLASAVSTGRQQIGVLVGLLLVGLAGGGLWLRYRRP